MKTPSQQSGFSLVEVLFAVFIFAVGLLGIAGLQLVAKQNSYDAKQRTTATMLATEIAEKIRTNSKGADSYVSKAEGVTTSSITGATCSSSALCAPVALAAYDLDSWYTSIIGATEKNTSTGAAVGGLISPSACITGVNNASGARVGYTIAIAWRGKIPLSNPTADACGSTSGLYGANNEYRRLFVLNIAI